MPKANIRKPKYFDNEGQEAYSDKWCPGDIVRGKAIEEVLPITATGTGISIGWYDTVQLKVVDHDSGTSLELELERREINNMIANLRKARDDAFGRDV